MKRLKLIMAGILVAVTLLPVSSVCSQTTAKKTLPKVPITYPGDTDKTIVRRAQWLEGAQKEGKLIWWTTLRQPEIHSIIGEFNKVYPSIKVEYWRGDGEAIASKVEAEFNGGRHTVDFLQGGEPGNYPRWRKIGIIEKFTDIIPAIEKLDKRMYGKNNDWVAVASIISSPTYNTKLVSAAEAPKSWEDLLNPKWKGKLGVTTDMKVWTNLALGEGKSWGITKTEEFLAKLKRDQNLIFAASHPVGHTMVISGEVEILADNYVRFVLLDKEKNAPVEWARVSPLSISGPSITLQKKAPHPNAARLFLEWLLSPQGLLLYEEKTRSGAAFPGTGTKTSKLVEGMPLVVRTEETLLKIQELGLDEKFAAILGVTSGK